MEYFLFALGWMAYLVGIFGVAFLADGSNKSIAIAVMISGAVVGVYGMEKIFPQWAISTKEFKQFLGRCSTFLLLLAFFFILILETSVRGLGLITRSNLVWLAFLLNHKILLLAIALAISWIPAMNLNIRLWKKFQTN